MAQYVAARMAVPKAAKMVGHWVAKMVAEMDHEKGLYLVAGSARHEVVR